MNQAINLKNQNVLADRVEVARTLSSRLKGLIGRKKLENGQGLLILRSGNSIHTFFMSFPIDLVFINHEGKVCWITKNLKPWRMMWAPIFSRTHCLELPQGTVDRTQTQVGDIIRVES